MEELSHIKVVIAGEVYELTSAESKEHVQNVASYIDKKMKEIYSKKSNGYINHRLKTLFISLNIADDLFKEIEKRKKLEQQVKELTKNLKNYTEENTIINEENKILLENITYLQEEVSKTKRELQDYIDNFDN